MKAQKGFTLLEMVVLATVIVVLVGVALPNFGATLEGNRELSEMNNLTAALTLARNTAAQSGRDVLVCASTDGRECADGDWSRGFTVAYLTPPPRTDAMIRRVAALSAHITLVSSASDRIVFHANGLTDLAGPTTFTICDSRGPNYARALDLFVSGLIQTSTKLGQDINGTPLVCT